MLSQEEFEDLVRKIIEGKTTRKKIAKEYHINSRSLNLKITELAEINPELYQEFIKKFPYRPKTITNVNFVELVKEIMKEDKEIRDLVIKYNISTRTISRRISKMKDSEEIDESTGMTLGELYSLYRRYREDDLSFEDKAKIDSMKLGTVQDTKDFSEHRRKYLEDLISKYNQYIEQGISKKQAAEKLGYNFLDMYKKENELKRIVTENVTRKEIAERNSQKKELPDKSKTSKERMAEFKKRLEPSITIEVPLIMNDGINAEIKLNQTENEIDKTEVTVEEK